MKEGTCRKTRRGQKYCKRGGKVRFVRGIDGIENIDDIGGIGQVSLSELAAFARGTRTCVTTATPTGIKTYCKTTKGGGRRKRVSDISGRRRKRRK